MEDWTMIKQLGVLILLLGYFMIFAANNVRADNLRENVRLKEVEKVLRDQNRRDWSKSPHEEHAEDLNYLGDTAIPLLATFLEDYDLGYDASETMLVINANKSAPLIFASMPKSNRNVQYQTFRYFIRKIQNGEPFDFSVEMHAAAVRCLNADTNADAAVKALLAIGLTGDEKDFPILERFYNNKHQTSVWKTRLRNASQAALARLGAQKYIQLTRDALHKPVPKSLTMDRGIEISNLLKIASFSGNKQYIPLLCKHLDDPYVRNYDTGVSPASDAAEALDLLINNSTEFRVSSVEFWKDKCMSMQ